MASRKPSKLLNYRTRVAASQTVSEIVCLLAGKKVSSVNIDYQNGKATAVTFVIRIADSLIPFRLAANIDGVMNRPEVRNQGREQGENVAWRIVFRWVEAQIALVEANQAEMGQVFLPYAVRDNGDMLWTAFQASHTKQLGNGSVAQ